MAAPAVPANEGMRAGRPYSVMVIVGTPAEAVKVAPVVRALAADRHFHPMVTVAPEQPEPMTAVLDVFDITADRHVALEPQRRALSELVTDILVGLDPILTETHPDLVVVQGDTQTTFAGALCASYHRIPVAHLEAGLRSGDRYRPYPGEIHRRLVTQLASLHLAPTPGAAANLRAEGVAPDTIVCTGNTVVDALRWTVSRGELPDVGVDLADRRVLLAILSHRDWWGPAPVGVGRALARLAEGNPDLSVVVVVHRDRDVRGAILPPLEGMANVTVVEPLAYPGFVALLSRADVVVTDSGGVQEEAPCLAKPVMVLRDVTERPEAVVAVTAELVGTDERRIVARVQNLLDDAGAYARMAGAVNPYGDGRAAGRVVAGLAWLMGDAGRPQEFSA
jgi:UDP-N-acetylglucosamine 2-epimerase (non-hydrolysing)